MSVAPMRLGGQAQKEMHLKSIEQWALGPKSSQGSDLDQCHLHDAFGTR